MLRLEYMSCVCVCVTRGWHRNDISAWERGIDHNTPASLFMMRWWSFFMAQNRFAVWLSSLNGDFQEEIRWDAATNLVNGDGSGNDVIKMKPIRGAEGKHRKNDSSKHCFISWLYWNLSMSCPTHHVIFCMWFTISCCYGEVKMILQRSVIIKGRTDDQNYKKIRHCLQ